MLYFDDVKLLHYIKLIGIHLFLGIFYYLRGKLTLWQKQENKKLAQERMICENAFSGVKRYNAVSDIYRNRVSKFDDSLILIACRLGNFYLEAA